MKRGFTLIELVMVIVILGILAATALPRFINLQTQAQESAAKGALGGIRAAVAVQYANNVTTNPSDATPWPTLAELIIADATSPFADRQVPKNPYNNSNYVVAGLGAAYIADDGAGHIPGWQYDAATGRVWLNDNVDFATHSTW